MLGKFVSYIFSLAVTTGLYVYILDLPTRLTGAKSLVHEYYYKNGVKSFVFDIFLILVYLGIALFIENHFQLTSTLQKSIVILLTTCIISTLFMFYFLEQPATSSFFASWFHEVGFKAVIYDMILIVTTYLLYKSFSNINIL